MARRDGTRHSERTQQTEEAGNSATLVSGERQYPFVDETEDGRVILWHPAGGCTILRKGRKLTDELRARLHQRAEVNAQFYPSDYDIYKVTDPRMVDGGQTIRHRESGEPVRVDLLSISPEELAKQCGIPDYQREWVLDACREYLTFRVRLWNIRDIPDGIPLLEGWLWRENPSGGCSILPSDTDMTDKLRVELYRKAEQINLYCPPGFKNGTGVDFFDMARAQKMRHRISGEWVDVDLLSVSPEELVEQCGIPESQRDMAIEACRRHLEMVMGDRDSDDAPRRIPLLQD